MSAAASFPPPSHVFPDEERDILPLSTYDNHLHALNVVNDWVSADNPEAVLEFCRPLESLPPLPDNVKKVAIYHNVLHEDTVLPDSITFLCIHHCGIHSVRWPAHLEHLTITSATDPTFAPFPESLKELSISYGFALPPLVLPPQLEHLALASTFLAKLPALPDTLRTLHATSCKLKTLPRTVPPHLTYVNLRHNNLRRLPVFPPTLTTLDASDNPLLLPQRTAWTTPDQEGMGLRIYLRDLYRIQEHPEEIPLWNDASLNENEVADPYGEEAWDDDAAPCTT